jgi:hypothetical protein
VTPEVDDLEKGTDLPTCQGQSIKRGAALLSGRWISVTEAKPTSVRRNESDPMLGVSNLEEN